MSLILAESKIPALIVAFLVTRRSDADYPVPASNLLTLVAGPVKDATKRVYPSLEVWCPGFSLEPRRDNEMIQVQLDLHADPDTAQATEDGWLAAIRRSFAGGPISGNSNSATAATNPFMSYLNGLSSGERAGWQVDDFHLTGGGNTISDQHRVIRSTTARCTFRSYVFTV